MTQPEHSPNTAAGAPELTEALAPLLARIADLPSEEREYWMNNFIEQVDEAQCVWSKGDDDWDSAANARKLQSCLEQLLGKLPPEALNEQIAAFIEEYDVSKELDDKYLVQCEYEPQNLYDAPALEEGEETYTVCEGYRLYKKGLLPGLED